MFVTALKVLFLLIAPPSLMMAYGHSSFVPFYYGALNLLFGYLFWRYRRPQVMVVACYLLSGMFLFKFLIDPLEVSALPPLPAPPPLLLAGTPGEQNTVGKGDGSRWTDWMKADAARKPRAERKEAAASDDALREIR